MEIILKYFSEFTPLQLDQFKKLEPLYRSWNEKINVISRKDIEGLYEKHVLHSLSIAAVFDFPPASEILDIGTGGGFPGIPLAIYFPESRFHLVDSIGKKIKVVNEISSALGLKNVTTAQIRAEDIRNREFDFVVSRAVAPLKDLWKWVQPLIRNKHFANPEQKTGLICLKGGDLAEEISESNTNPRIFELSGLFNESYFREKYMLYLQVNP